MIEVRKIVTGPWDENCYVLGNGAGACLLIDPGDDAAAIQQVIESARWKVLAILKQIPALYDGSFSGRVYLVEGWSTHTFLAMPDTFTDEQVSRLRLFSETRRFKLRDADDFPSPQAETEKGANIISPDDLAQWLVEQDPSIRLIDVRNPSEYQSYHLPEALNIPLDAILAEEYEVYFDQDIKIKPIQGATSSLYFDTSSVEYDRRDASWAFLALPLFSSI